MFQGYNEKSGIFDNRLRMLIVDNILINLTYKMNNDNKTITLDDEIKSTVYKNLKLSDCSKDFLEKLMDTTEKTKNDSKTYFRGLTFKLTFLKF